LSVESVENPVEQNTTDRGMAAPDNVRRLRPTQPAPILLAGLHHVHEALETTEAYAHHVEAEVLRAIGVQEELRRTFRESREQLQQEFGFSELLKPLRELPAEIKAARLSASSAQAVLDQAFEQLKVAEANIEMDVASEINEMGKPRYSNAESRAAAVRTRKQIDPAYQEALEFVQGTKQLLAERQAELEMLLQAFEAAKLAAQLTAAQLAAIQR